MEPDPVEPGLEVPWHQALVLAVTGEVRSDLGLQREPDLALVLALVRPALDGSDRPGAHAVPADLVRGIGAARFAAVLRELRTRLGSSDDRPVLADRAPDADERRLLAEVPPHH